MTSEAEIAVIIPAFNAEKYLQQALQSLLSQTLTCWHAIVVDDGSSDRTAEIAQSVADDRIRLIQQKNAGVSAARNTGLSCINAEFVLFLDADDFLYKDALHRLFDALTTDDNLVFAYGEARRFRDDIPRQAEASPPIFADRPDGSDIQGFFVSNCASTTGTILFRTEAIRSLCGFNTALQLGEDWELLARIVTRGPVKYIPGPPLCAYREHPDSAVKRHAMIIDQALIPVEAIFNNTLVREFLPCLEHATLKQQARLNAHIFCATQNIKARQWRQANDVVKKGLSLKPMTFRLWILLLFSSLRRLPKALDNRLK
jgi:glycosyltransferase involved in cell wall biosynthesis